MSGQEIYEYNLGPSNSKHCKPMFHARLSCSIQPYTLQCIAEPFSKFRIKDPTGIGIKQKELRNIWFKTFFQTTCFSLSVWLSEVGFRNPASPCTNSRGFCCHFLGQVTCPGPVAPNRLVWPSPSVKSRKSPSASNHPSGYDGLWVNDLRIHRILDRQVAQILVQCFQVIGVHNQVAYAWSVLLKNYTKIS